ncbi:MAG TPA: RnfABCDGE type electron transport complex subunit D [Bacteroidales bacterium]|nr:RnfABCDGE type electron transport complex subunit D [Bacteroidales bacterium]
MNNRLLQVSGSPHVHSGESVKKIMWAVIFALVPAFLVSIYYFGLPVIIITAVSVLSCILFEYIATRFFLREKSTISNGSAVLTGLLLAFNLPSTLPIPWVILGSLVAIVVGKMVFGGLGNNLFNPALVGRVFLLISRPVDMTTWPVAKPIWNFGADVVTGPTPLGILKEGVKNGETMDAIQTKLPTYVDMLFGNMGGSFGEVSAIALLIGAAFLFYKKILTWHIPVSFVLSAFLFAWILNIVDPTHYVNPFFHLVTGGLILGAFYMATDMVTSPVSPIGMIIFGVGCGLITILIRVFGAYPEGVSFAILLMNGVTPLINKGFKPKKFGN